MPIENSVKLRWSREHCGVIEIYVEELFNPIICGIFTRKYFIPYFTSGFDVNLLLLVGGDKVPLGDPWLCNRHRVLSALAQLPLFADLLPATLPYLPVGLSTALNTSLHTKLFGVFVYFY